MALRFDHISDLSIARQAWESLSPHESLYDDWDFRNTFHKFHQKEICFIGGYENDQLVGLLPLQYNADNGYFEFFGGDYMEDNRAFTAPGFEACIPALYDQAKQLGKPLKLRYIRGDDPFTTKLHIEDYKFILPLTFKTGEAYIDSVFDGETKKKLSKRLRKTEELGVTIIENDSDAVEQLIEWNMQMFKDSAFVDRPFHKEIFRELAKPHRTFTTRFLTYVVAGEKQAVTMGIVYNGSYASVNRGIKPSADKNLREYVHIKKVEDALKQGCTLFDAFVGDYGWKERWGCQKIPQHEFMYPENNSLNA